jgi:hypothetical protein
MFLNYFLIHLRHLVEYIYSCSDELCPYLLSCMTWTIIFVFSFLLFFLLSYLGVTTLSKDWYYCLSSKSYHKKKKKHLNPRSRRRVCTSVPFCLRKLWTPHPVSSLIYWALKQGETVDFKRLQKTSRDFKGLYETSRLKSLLFPHRHQVLLGFRVFSDFDNA